MRYFFICVTSVQMHLAIRSSAGLKPHSLLDSSIMPNMGHECQRLISSPFSPSFLLDHYVGGGVHVDC